MHDMVQCWTMWSHGGHTVWHSAKPNIIFLRSSIQGTFHQSLVKVGPAVSEELMKIWKVYDNVKDDIQQRHERQMQNDDKSSHGHFRPGELKMLRATYSAFTTRNHLQKTSKSAEKSEKFWNLGHCLFRTPRNSN